MKLYSFILEADTILAVYSNHLEMFLSFHLIQHSKWKDLSYY